MAPGHGAGGQYPEQLVRLDEFREEHPGILIGHDEFGGWEASIPLHGDGERFLARGDLGQLLDDAREVLAGGDPRANPD
jgi:hypothetical protein